MKKPFSFVLAFLINFCSCEYAPIVSNKSPDFHRQIERVIILFRSEKEQSELCELFGVRIIEKLQVSKVECRFYSETFNRESIELDETRMNLDSITESFNADAFLRIDFVGQTVWSGSQVTRQKDFNSSLFDLKGNKKRVWRSYFHLTTKADMFYNNNRLDAADLTDLLFNQLKKDRIIN